MRIDLHCHSMYSKRPSLWIMQKIGCPESFTHPRELYRILMAKGMHAVTITDHNTIEGCLEIAHLPNTFISNEVTAYFPDDRCKIHVLVYDITEAQQVDIDELRGNVIELTEYLNRKQIFHVCAHPLFGVNDRLTVDHVEKLVLLFKNWELNGDQNSDANRMLEQIAAQLSPAFVDCLVDKHGIVPRFAEPWKKNWTGGSDDHSALHLASTYTEVPEAETLGQFWRGIENGRASILGNCSTPRRMAHNIYGIAYQFYKSKFDLDRHTNKDVLLKFLDRSLQATQSAEPGMMDRVQSILNRRRSRSYDSVSSSVTEMLRAESEKLIRNDLRLRRIVEHGDFDNSAVEDEWFEFANRLSNSALHHFGNRLLDRFVRARFFDLFASLGSAGALYAVLAPYFVSYSLHSKQRRFNAQVHDAWFGTDPSVAVAPKIAHFTDTFYEVNGVARTLQQHAELAALTGKDYTIVACHPCQVDRPGAKNFKPIGVYEMPEYPELKLYVPPFLEMLDYCFEAGFTHIHSATPGPVGLAALAIARILKLPIAGTYHTAMPQYALHLTDNDGFVEEFVWKSMIAYYQQMDVIYVPSKSTGRQLIERGLAADRVRVYPRGIDIEQFHPSKRNGLVQELFGSQEGITLLYVGRISKEKNLHVLAEAFRRLAQESSNVRLLLVGDGPYRAELEASLDNSSVKFTGYLEGEKLAQAYASADLFVFPSTTDTFGNVVLEAQASGLPVVVTDQGGPCENLVPGETGVVVEGDSVVALYEALRDLTSDSARIEGMSKAARRYAESRSFRHAFEETWNMYVSDFKR